MRSAAAVSPLKTCLSMPSFLEPVQDGEVPIDCCIEQAIEECFWSEREQFAVLRPAALLVREILMDSTSVRWDGRAVDEAVSLTDDDEHIVLHEQVELVELDFFFRVDVGR